MAFGIARVLVCFTKNTVHAVCHFSALLPTVKKNPERRFKTVRDASMFLMFLMWCAKKINVLTLL
jgi:hypothetical protein